MEPEDFALLRMRDCSHFAHRARHELMTPVSGLTMLMSVMGRDGDAEGSDLMAQAMGALQRITRIARACVDYVDAELPLPAFASVDCNSLIADAERFVRADGGPKFERADIETKGSMPVLRGHAPALRRVFVALLDNAIRYTKDEPAHVTVTASCDGGKWNIEIADRGVGLDESRLDAVFAPFERQHAYDSIPGVGLSLATARRIARKHGGDLSLRARAGSGTVAMLTLPAS